ncbi:hypothetical protein PSACC_02993 [Paramicrosporidium saccamoebae]|uniref:Small ribosomal subunit protein mS35 mitochondrial conserved domain-containing protein n=1 Tax=Paramicrosporidium saccamoebae TaxID=1246581 RepID=A0A2H9THI4_9FUNG|nr:hypothetical protein PSACC_02993 [Paramicrosporidium saccamoebae]
MKNFKSFPTNIHAKESARITTRYVAGEPGCERQFDPTTAAVTIRVRIKSLGLTADESQVLRMLLSEDRYSERTDSVSFVVNDFPFQAQNRKRALEILKDLVDECKTVRAKTLLASTDTDTLKPLKRRPKAGLSFPKQWLPKIRQAAQ